MDIDKQFLEQIQTACEKSPQVAVKMMAETLITLSAMTNEELAVETNLGSLSVYPNKNLSKG
jgi:hypothetical protein